MGELRGRRPDQPPEEPDQPAKSGDRPRTPEPASDSNNASRAVWRGMRRSESFGPSAESPRVGVRHETNRDLGPVSPRPYLTANDRPAPRSKPDRPDGPTHRAPDIEPPSGEELSDEDAPDKPTRDKVREAIFEELDDLYDSTKETVNAIDDALDRPSPTGQHLQCRPRETEAHPAHPYGVDAGTTAGSMLAIGLVIGHLTMRAYRKAAERKERANARNR